MFFFPPLTFVLETSAFFDPPDQGTTISLLVHHFILGQQQQHHHATSLQGKRPTNTQVIVVTLEINNKLTDQ